MIYRNGAFYSITFTQTASRAESRQIYCALYIYSFCALFFPRSLSIFSLLHGRDCLENMGTKMLYWKGIFKILNYHFFSAFKAIDKIFPRITICSYTLSIMCYLYNNKLLATITKYMICPWSHQNFNNLQILSISVTFNGLFFNLRDYFLI